MKRRDFIRSILIAPLAPHLEKLIQMLPNLESNGVITDKIMRDGIDKLARNSRDSNRYVRVLFADINSDPGEWKEIVNDEGGNFEIGVLGTLTNGTNHGTD